MVTVLLAATAASCGYGPSKTTSPPTPFGAGKASAQEKTVSLALYYVKFKDNDAFLVREIHRVPYTEDGPRAALNELINSAPVTEGAVNVLPAGTRLLDVSVKDGLATVNFSREVLSANVGATGEALGIKSIVNTLTEFPEIREVSFQVDGKLDSRAREWWGHVGLYEQPFKRDLDKVEEPAIWVTHPSPGQAAGVPLLVRGSARSFEGMVTARLQDSAGKTIAEERTAVTREVDGRVDFEMKLTFTPPGKGTGTLEVYRSDSGGRLPGNSEKITIQWP